MLRPNPSQDKKRRPLSQSLSINNLHRLSLSSSTSKSKENQPQGPRTDPRSTKSKNRLSRVISSSEPSVTTTTATATTNHSMGSLESLLKPKSSRNSSRSDTSQTPTNSLPKSRPKPRSMLLDDKDGDKRKSKRFSMSFMRFNESSDSDNDDKSTIDTSPFTQNNDSNSLNLSSTDTESVSSPDRLKFDVSASSDLKQSAADDYDTTVESKKRTSNLSNIMEFVNQINYGFDDSLVINNRRLIESEAHHIDSFNHYDDYNVKLVGNSMLFGYFDEDYFTGQNKHEQNDMPAFATSVLGLDDIDYGTVLAEDYHEE